MRLSFILVCSALIIGCYESNLPDENEIELSHEDILKQSIFQVDDLRMKLEKLDLNDGVSLDEANTILGNFYLSGKADACGAPGNIVNSGDQWKAATFVGFSAKRSAPIYINKVTGALKRNNKVLVSNPKTLVFEDPVYYLLAKQEIRKIEE